MTNKKQIIIDTTEYFVEIVDEGKSTIGYNVVLPGKLLTEIMKQNKQLIYKTQECKELKKEYEKLQNTWIKQSRVLSYKKKSIEALKRAVLFKENNRYIQSCLVQKKQLEYEEVLNKLFQDFEQLKQEREEFETELALYKTWYRTKHGDIRDCLYHYRKALEEIENIADDYDRIDKTSQYYRDGFEQILDIINKAKGEV